MFICTNLLFCWPVAVGDSGLYYVLCDESCLTADKGGGGGNPKSETNSKRWKFPKMEKEELGNFFAACEQFGLLQCRRAVTLAGSVRNPLLEPFVG